MNYDSAFIPNKIAVDFHCLFTNYYVSDSDIYMIDLIRTILQMKTNRVLTNIFKILLAEKNTRNCPENLNRIHLKFSQWMRK